MGLQSTITPRDLEHMLCDETAEPKALPLSLLVEITDGFSDEQRIGSGGFSVVYKGMLENRTVAVKRLSNTYMYAKEFQREVECLMMVKHKNVVRFLGYCADTQGSMERHEGKFVMADVQQRLLCFEYLPKGSLNDYITDTSHGLRWRDRYQIITGICKGLHYLHQKNIVHLDLKPANILLDDNWAPKITDFGISRCFDEMQSQVITKIAGTPGYWAPEVFNHSEVTYRHSYRLDIYSLGIVIMEIITGKKGYHDIDEVVESWSNMLEESQSEVQHGQVRVCAEIGIECSNFNPAMRPDTQHIISRLNETDDYTETGMITSQQVLPADLRLEIKRQLCLDRIRRVPFFSQMDDQHLDAIRERLVSSLYTKGTYIVREGDPVIEMLFIIRGKLESSTTNGGRTGFFNSVTLKPGDFCGEELLVWVLDVSANLPSSTRTVKSLVEVEAFSLQAEDLKCVATQFIQLQSRKLELQSRKLEHTFRYYSHQWRLWGSCFIQAAWRRYRRRKMAKDLSMRESVPSMRSDHSDGEDDPLEEEPLSVNDGRENRGGEQERASGH